LEANVKLLDEKSALLQRKFLGSNKLQRIKIFSPNLTGEYVSRIEKKALGKLREKFEQG
jgi:DNA-directed RNA polymerase specialized sigma subunit